MKLGIQFGDGTLGMGKKLNKSSRCVTSLTLSYVRRNGHGCSSHLRNKAEFFFGRKSSG